MIKYEKTCQQEGQKIVSFIVYLNFMNNELEYNNEQWQRHLLMKIHPTLQKKIQEMPVPPVNHHVLINYVQWLEGLKEYKSKIEPAQN